MNIGRLMDWFQSALLTLIVLFGTYHFFFSSPPVIEIESYELISDQVKAGGDILLKFTMSRNKVCPFVTTFRLLTDNATDKVVDVQAVSPKTLDVGRHQRGTVAIRVPDSFMPGDYRFQAITFNAGCLPDGESFTAVSPVRNFTVVE